MYTERHSRFIDILMWPNAEFAVIMKSHEQGRNWERNMWLSEYVWSNLGNLDNFRPATWIYEELVAYPQFTKQTKQCGLSSNSILYWQKWFIYSWFDLLPHATSFLDWTTLMRADDPNCGDRLQLFSDIWYESLQIILRHYINTYLYIFSTYIHINEINILLK